VADGTNTRAPVGDLSTFERTTFTHDGRTRTVYRKGSGPAVLVITEMPGISPMVLGFADRVVGLGCTAVLPDLFGEAGRDPYAGNRLIGTLRDVGTMIGTCISRDFTALVAGRSSRVVDWLRALAAHEHAQCGGPGVGVIGMCFTGGFALAMAVDPVVLAPVLSQPSLPFGVTKTRKASIDTSPADIATVAGRCSNEGLRVLGMRFHGDPLVPRERFQYLREQLGDGFVAIELEQADGNSDDPMGKHHSVVTGALIDEPGQRTREALDAVLDLFRAKLRGT
jgi:dienelactone hydrolase